MIRSHDAIAGSMGKTLYVSVDTNEPYSIYYDVVSLNDKYTYNICTYIKMSAAVQIQYETLAARMGAAKLFPGPSKTLF